MDKSEKYLKEIAGELKSIRRMMEKDRQPRTQNIDVGKLTVGSGYTTSDGGGSSVKSILPDRAGTWTGDSLTTTSGGGIMSHSGVPKGFTGTCTSAGENTNK